MDDMATMPRTHTKWRARTRGKLVGAGFPERERAATGGRHSEPTLTLALMRHYATYIYRFSLCDKREGNEEARDSFVLVVASSEE